MTMKEANLLMEFFDRLDQEFEHGNYCPPESVPTEYDGEVDYYGNHEEIVSIVAEKRFQLQKIAKKVLKLNENSK